MSTGKNSRPSGTAKQATFWDMPVSYFPLTVELIDVAAGNVVWSVTVEGPGALHVPAAKSLGVECVRARITSADGTISESG